MSDEHRGNSAAFRLRGQQADHHHGSGREQSADHHDPRFCGKTVGIGHDGQLLPRLLSEVDDAVEGHGESPGKDADQDHPPLLWEGGDMVTFGGAGERLHGTARRLYSIPAAG